MESDEHLVKAVLSGDRASFADLVKRYEPAARAVALNVLRENHAAQDAVQESFFKAYEKLASLRKPCAFGLWILKVTRRCALGIARERSREAALRQDIEIAAKSMARIKTLSERFVAARDGDGQLDMEMQSLLGVIARLPGHEQQVVMLRYFSGADVKVIAGITGRSVGTVTKQITRALRRLRKWLKEEE